MNNFKLVTELKIENCSLDVGGTDCFMYDFENNGFTKEELEQAFNGRTLQIYEWNRKFKGRKITRRRCPWCGESFKDLNTHQLTVHNKNTKKIYARMLQDEFYKVLLTKVREGHYLATAYTNQRCQFCTTPRVEGREGICAIPESARNKVQSFKVLGFLCDGFKEEWLNSPDICYLIL